MREHIKAFLLASSLAFGIPTFVEAEPLERAAGEPHEMRAMRWLRKLDLTGAQRDQIFRIFHDQAPTTREQMKRVHRACEALRQAALSPDFDRAQAGSLADAAAKALSDMALLRAETLSRVAAVLSPEQRGRLVLFRSQ
ncbi:MAG TPA: Spy/CpxP family protein refolding chaperone [Burkholderiales bacterium]|jgi:Spy/CpxP family protein refolding chaperone|nr:Spy/CpxP family protein refolding chaperone [Burkholderiales bacterium]